MSRFLLESIKIENGKIPLLDYHQNRMNYSVYQVFGLKNTIYLDSVFENIVFQRPAGVFKCRIVYNQKIQKIDISAYQIKPVRSLKIIESDIDYCLKYENRSEIQALFSQKENCDDILILKNGYLTDTSYCNVFLFDGHQWWTPNTCLLKGTQRSYLLANGMVRERSIHIKDLNNYQKIRLCNAMIDWNDKMDLSVLKVE